MLKLATYGMRDRGPWLAVLHAQPPAYDTTEVAVFMAVRVG